MSSVSIPRRRISWWFNFIVPHVMIVYGLLQCSDAIPMFSIDLIISIVIVYQRGHSRVVGPVQIWSVSIVRINTSNRSVPRTRSDSSRCSFEWNTIINGVSICSIERWRNSFQENVYEWHQPIPLSVYTHMVNRVNGHYSMKIIFGWLILVHVFFSGIVG